MEKLKDIRVAILTEQGFEESELVNPKQALENAGAITEVISPKGGKIKAWNHTDWGMEINVDKTIDEAQPGDYDGLLIPGGVMNPDKLRMNEKAVAFAKEFLRQGKPVAAICHGPQLLIETGLLTGRTMTSYPSLKTDLKNAGVNWVDKEVVHDASLITSRKPADLEAFNAEFIKALEDVHSHA